MAITVAACSGLGGRLSKHAAQSTGTNLLAWLVGVRAADKLVLLGTVGVKLSQSAITLASDLESDAELAAALIPAGLLIVGAVVLTNGDVEIAARELAQQEVAMCKQGAPIKPQVNAVVHSGDSTVTFWTTRAPIHSVEVEDCQQQGLDFLRKEFGLLRFHLPVTLELAALDSAESLAGSVLAAFDRLENQLCGEATVVVAQPSDSQERLMVGSGGKSSTCKSCSASSFEQPLELEVLRSSHAESAVAPSIEYQPFNGGVARTRRNALAIDVLWYVPKTAPLSGLRVETLRDSIRRQLVAMRRHCQETGDASGAASALHFIPLGLSHHCTVVYPFGRGKVQVSGEVEKKLEGHRRELHERLLLPTDRPLLRSANSICWNESKGGSSVLRNVHEGLKPSGVPNGKLHMVWGTYSYHHYMQGRFDDSGWGCAYRSLQTLWSWFCHQHFTDKDVPSHREIQQTLVDIGDKERSFVGSQQWIGAIELGFVLETLLGVTSKVITVTNGADIDEKASEIARHFDTQGTPIMIGGGVLAYTLLGVDLNHTTGECAFLILDPHYTGADDIRKIQKGQWVAWKRSDSTAAADGDLFVRNAFYNLLCPLKPDMI